ncbi:hypothetical protein FOA52_000664 [Chlamydomonas sp. UWO 241]|nr:hypothetical protein FOA52_000664 [Chlamydomonas sp. UWO 241]
MELTYRGPRLKMAIMEGPPRSVLPDLSGRACYMGPAVTRATRLCSTGAHGRQVVTEEGLACAMMAAFAPATPQEKKGRASMPGSPSVVLIPSALPRLNMGTSLNGTSDSPTSASDSPASNVSFANNSVSLIYSMTMSSIYPTTPDTSTGTKAAFVGSATPLAENPLSPDTARLKRVRAVAAPKWGSPLRLLPCAR